MQHNATRIITPVSICKFSQRQAYALSWLLANKVTSIAWTAWLALTLQLRPDAHHLAHLQAGEFLHHSTCEPAAGHHIPRLLHAPAVPQLSNMQTVVHIPLASPEVWLNPTAHLMHDNAGAQGSRNVMHMSTHRLPCA